MLALSWLSFASTRFWLGKQLNINWVKVSELDYAREKRDLRTALDAEEMLYLQRAQGC
ncbi:hypothetical protein VITU9109_24585 [Vibrio tubiashii ATCC 19109]|uniref:Uncharacterized protein n=1 Tax=Vibrio tubiashii ATCC 19109 TaxID=1051646 RepID=A0ABN0DCY6_9VIBR|nr:hypothetical protein VITU9109_24585 [Vibrio tubiashii ATCC 19109]